MNKQQLQQEIEALQKQLEEKQKALAAMPEKWEPNGGEYCVDAYGRVIKFESEEESRDFGSEYETRQQAEKAAKAMRAHNRLLAYVAEFAPDWEPDWLDDYQLKVEVVFNASSGEWCAECSLNSFNPSTVYMPEYVAEELAVKLNSGEVEL